MNATPATTSPRVAHARWPAHGARRWALAAVAALTLAAAGLAAWLALGASSRAAPPRTDGAAVTLDFPPPLGPLPPSISLSYDAAKDRTSMTLRLRDFAGVACPLGQPRSIEMKLVSQFRGRQRPADEAELSVQCEVSMVTSQPGALAPASPPGEFRTEAHAVRARPASPGRSGYHAKPKADGTHESLSFKLSTRDLILLAQGQHVEATLGAVQLTFTPGQLSDLHEFVAAMKPGAN